jgi:hypothetical protein
VPGRQGETFHFQLERHARVGWDCGDIHQVTVNAVKVALLGDDFPWCDAHFFLLPFFTQLLTVLPPFFFVPRFS